MSGDSYPMDYAALTCAEQTAKIAAAVAAWPPLKTEQRDALASLFAADD